MLGRGRGQWQALFVAADAWDWEGGRDTLAPRPSAPIPSPSTPPSPQSHRLPSPSNRLARRSRTDTAFFLPLSVFQLLDPRSCPSSSAMAFSCPLKRDHRPAPVRTLDGEGRVVRGAGRWLVTRSSNMGSGSHHCNMDSKYSLRPCRVSEFSTFRPLTGTAQLCSCSSHQKVASYSTNSR